MILTHRIALDPTDQQEQYFRRAAGIARFVWNWALAIEITTPPCISVGWASPKLTPVDTAESWWKQELNRAHL
jgi:hypothetical protein